MLRSPEHSSYNKEIFAFTAAISTILAEEEQTIPVDFYEATRLYSMGRRGQIERGLSEKDLTYDDNWGVGTHKHLDAGGLNTVMKLALGSEIAILHPDTLLGNFELAQEDSDNSDALPTHQSSFFDIVLFENELRAHIVLISDYSGEFSEFAQLILEQFGFGLVVKPAGHAAVKSVTFLETINKANDIARLRQTAVNLHEMARPLMGQAEVHDSILY